MADVKAVIEPKPTPSDAILTDAQAAERYNVEVETWGERLSRAGARICRALVADGTPLPFTCPESAQ
ncbi:MAG: hypothetical protein P0Y64_16905 [Candidatus Sphingomonas colombiensis]|nr:hypothetical protein [Sphingomonas sp.]WEK42999.1 MAG: hypothetical protein P0Y64_16905 [Sphingomonas sp.]